MSRKASVPKVAVPNMCKAVLSQYPELDPHDTFFSARPFYANIQSWIHMTLFSVQGRSKPISRVGST
ncbi:hypothetical protein RRG08_004067 [Elysia crispata]|uniref:Uncharacterized protein n=1 Tax=Elysia crispata TaxID=231223 RepID=A0AAE1DYH5_9GAST|nr:hypothetical protein RRG08_004067 [Elysia crispata]